jgi:hypothetical protein
MVKRGSPETEETFVEDGIEKFDTGGVMADEAEDWVAEVAGVGVETGIEALIEVVAEGVGVETLIGVGVGVEDTEVGALIEVVAEGVGVGTLIDVGVGMDVGTVTVVFVGTIVVAVTAFPSKEAVVLGPIIP